MMRRITFEKAWLINQLEYGEYPYFEREKALKTVVGNYRNFFAKIHRCTFSQLIQVCAIVRRESVEDVFKSICNDFDLYKNS